MCERQDRKLIPEEEHNLFMEQIMPTAFALSIVLSALFATCIMLFL